MTLTSDSYTNTDIRLIACTNRQLQVSIIFLTILTILTTILMINTLITQSLVAETHHRAEELIKQLENSSAVPSKILVRTEQIQIQSLPEPTRRPVTLQPKKGFTWPAENSLCPANGSSTKKILLNLIHSARENAQKRRMIRKTWSSLRTFGDWSIFTVFLLGGKKLSENQEATMMIEEEARDYGDIALKTHFIDTYHNLSEKHAMGYEWVSTFCRQATAVLKSDDDFVIDVFKVIKWLNKTRVKGYNCRVYGRNKPSRDPESKWYVPVMEYPGTFFPPFCSGGVYLTNARVIERVLKSLPETRKIWLDDVYVTGLGVQTANYNNSRRTSIKHHDRSEEYAYYHWDLLSGMDLFRDWAASSIKISPWSFILVEHSPEFENDFELIWKKIVSLHKVPV